MSNLSHHPIILTPQVEFLVAKCLPLSFCHSVFSAPVCYTSPGRHRNVSRQLLQAWEHIASSCCDRLEWFVVDIGLYFNYTM